MQATKVLGFPPERISQSAGRGAHFGLTEAALARLRGPIGIYIGSKTPPEIAVSVMAEVLAVKNGVLLPRDMQVARAKNERAVAENGAEDLVCGVVRIPS